MFPYRKILCPTDFSDLSDEALKVAGVLAARFEAELCVLHVVTPPPPDLAAVGYISANFRQENLTPAREQLEALVAERVPATVSTRTLLGYGGTVDEIERAVRGENADLIVLATHGLTGWRHLIYGSVTEETARIAPCPVLAIHHGKNGAGTKSLLPVKKILCAVDFSEPASEALSHAGALAEYFGAELEVLNVVMTLSERLASGEYSTSEYDRLRLSEAQARLCELIAERTPTKAGAKPLVRLGNAAEEIERAAKEEQTDLIVLATHGLTGWRHLVYGSVAERVLHLTQFPLLVVHATNLQ